MINSVSVIFPVYNEKEYVRIAVKEVSGVLNSMNADYEIIIVDDGSNDGSSQIIDELMRINSKIKALHHRKNRGLGAALKTGFSKASNDILIYSDTDLPCDLSRVKDILPFSGEIDIFQGYRIGKRESLRRTLYFKIYNFIIKLIFKLRVKDVNCGFRIFKREILARINLKSESSFINVEFLGKAQKMGYKISEFGSTYRPRKYGFSKLSSLNTIKKILFELQKFYLEIKRANKK